MYTLVTHEVFPNFFPCVYFTVKQHYFDSNVIKKEKVKHRLHVETIFMELESCMTIDRVACLKTLFYGTIWSFTKHKFR